MKSLSEEELNTQFATFWSNMESAGVSKHYDPDKLFAVLSISPAGVSEDSGLAYPGALLVHINLVTSIAQRLRAMISGTFSIDEKRLTKVCVLQHLSKTAMFKLNDNDWEVKNRGLNYKFNELEGCLKAGERSIMYANMSGIIFNASEFEAMRCIDKEENQANTFATPMATIVRQANELALMIERERNKNQ